MTDKPYKVKKVNKQFRSIPPDMRQLPSELVTHDTGDKERIHKNDPSHVRRELLKTAAKELVKQAPPLLMAQAYVKCLLDKYEQDGFKFEKVDQEVVDLYKMRIILNWLHKGTLRDSMFHLWFTTPNAKSVVFCDGIAPERAARPAHLKNLNLEIHPLDWSSRMRDIVKLAGIDPETILEDIDADLKNQRFETRVKQAETNA